MSLNQPDGDFPGIPLTRPGLSFSAAGSDNHIKSLPAPSPLPSLPPVSSLLLPRNEQMLAEQLRNPSESRQPLYGEKKHPLYLSELNPTAPVQHVYHPPHPLRGSRNQFDRAEPLLVPNQTPNPLDIQFQLGQPPSRRRQSRKIGQRRDDIPKDDPRASKSSVALQPYQKELDNTKTSDDQEQSSMPSTVPRELSRSIGAAPLGHELSRAIPMSRILRDSPILEPKPLEPQYVMKVRQQPLAARACGFGERDRRVVDPPPILQVTLHDQRSTEADPKRKPRIPFSVVHCTLWNPVTDKDESAMPGATDKRLQRRLMGTLVASPFVGKDENDIEGCFFCFPDLSVRTPGSYCLKFSLVVLDPTKMSVGNSVPVRTTVLSNPFQVYHAKDFGGMLASSDLTKRLKSQGCLISVKKGNAKNNGSHSKDDTAIEKEDEDEDEDDDGDNKETESSIGAKRRKR